MEFLPDFGLDTGNRRYHAQTTAPEPQPGIQGKVALAAIRGEQTLVELSQQFDVHADQIKPWKDQLHEEAVSVFDDEAKAELAGPTVEVKTLHAEIGELTPENDFCPVRSARRDCREEIHLTKCTKLFRQSKPPRKIIAQNRTALTFRLDGELCKGSHLKQRGIEPLYSALMPVSWKQNPHDLPPVFQFER